MSSSLVILFGVVKQFGRFWIWSETECKIPAEYGLQHNSPPPPPDTHCLFILYIYSSLGRGGGGRLKREDRGATVHKYSSFVHGGNSSQAGSKLPTNEWMYLQSIKSVKYNATNSVNRSILKKSRHKGFGVFIVHSSMGGNNSRLFISGGGGVSGWSTEAKSEVTDWGIKVDSGIGLRSILAYTATKTPLMYSFSGNCTALVPIVTLMCLWAIYIFPRSVHIQYFLQQNRRIDRGNIYKSLTAHECGNWDCGRAIPFQGIFVSNFRYLVFAV
jgi:hypothetical protein